MKADTLHPDRLFPADVVTRDIARLLYGTVANLPIISPHGHTDPSWFADNLPFPDPIEPVHQAGPLCPPHALQPGHPARGSRHPPPRRRRGRNRQAQDLAAASPRIIACSAARRPGCGSTTPSRKSSASPNGSRPRPPTTFSITSRHACRNPNSCRGRCSRRFNIEVIATTESPLDDLKHHRKIRESGWKGRVVTAFRPDPVVDPDFGGFAKNVVELGRITGCDTATWKGYLDALAARRRYFKEVGGCTSTDHGHPTAAHGRPVRGRRGRTVRARSQRRRLGGRRRTLPRPDAHRNGAHEPRRRSGDADPSGLVAQPQPAALGRVSAATWAPTSRPRPTMSAP